MKTEFEIRFLDFDEKGLVAKLKKAGAAFVGDWLQVRNVYDFEKPRRGRQTWMRLRTNGEQTTLAIKEITADTIDGTRELEVDVSDFDTMAAILERLGFRPKGRQESKRKRYMLDGVEIDIDTWPLIPTYVELEGENEAQIKSVCAKIGLDYADGCTMGVQDIATKVYKIPMEKLAYTAFG